jgi:hypothetical protein
MVGDVMLAGFRLTYAEWEALDYESKMQLVRACAQIVPQPIEEDPYETYEIVVE